jgi:hypothetical protein
MVAVIQLKQNRWCGRCVWQPTLSQMQRLRGCWRQLTSAGSSCTAVAEVARAAKRRLSVQQRCCWLDALLLA